MKLTRLRIVGFKTFVEPTDIPIEPGLTGIVGPNGCGKSNLVEALRWAMGESSHKSMRAAGMDDVIFAGSGGRPARNTAEVVLAIDNTSRTAPAAFNDSDALEISRKIEREHGSAYRVNGREVRARDVQLLFADAATGARSPALVRQGQISEIIAAKPQARRRILEDAAGIAGLHARRHEAELRLRQAEDNLVRVEDVLREIDAQADALRRQGRQASRYRNLSGEIRRAEAALALLALRNAEAELEAAEAAASVDLAAVADRATEQTRAATAQAVAAHEIGPIREAEVTAAAALRRLTEARTALEHEERRSRERLSELGRRIAEIEGDLAGQTALERDATASVERLRGEAADAEREAAGAAGRRGALEAERQVSEAKLAAAETALAAVQGEFAEIAAQRAGLEAARRTEGERAARLRREREKVDRESAALDRMRGDADLAALRSALAGAQSASLAADDAAAVARARLQPAREAEGRARSVAVEAERVAQRLETELRTLAKLFSAGPAKGETGPAAATMLDALRAEPGYETALGAALGDDLHASSDASAAIRWTEIRHTDADPALPAGASPLAAHVTAPPAMARRLRQIGLVEREAGAALMESLAIGQRLVSREGDIWRWDGFAARADAPTAAARRLTEKNRLADLEQAAVRARADADERRADAQRHETVLREAVAAEAAASDEARGARRAYDAAREALAAAERRDLEGAARRSALAEARSRLEAGEIEAGIRIADSERGLAALGLTEAVQARLATVRAEAAERRSETADARAALAALEHDAGLAARRAAALAAEIRTWTERHARAASARADLAGRLATARAEHDELAAAPDVFTRRRRSLQGEIERAEVVRKDAADALARAATKLAESDRLARAALDALSEARERRAASAVRAEGLLAQVAATRRSVAEQFGTEPAGLPAIAGLAPGARLPDPAATEARLAALRAERERLGGVNLRAEEELTETETKLHQLAGERDDLTKAIGRLRQAIGSLNREGRERLAAAFGIVAGHFTRLFTSLFGGGAAELTLIDSDDPLEAGLEILARPPGKKTQSLSLLSGGEQALTAIALIFAVFLTNPSPICVLDEVDAPLDDANVERYCDLLRAMVADTQTRFVVITHNPITMARMDRLFGVTMAERGVSQLVSVDLEGAERMREAG
jgi:chromosome segregation protein